MVRTDEVRAETHKPAHSRKSPAPAATRAAHAAQNHPPRHTPAVLSGASTAFGAVFDASGEALLILDSAGAIQRANSGARTLLHLPESYAHCHLRDCLPAPAAEQLPHFLKRPDTRRKIEISLSTGVTANVTLRWIFPDSGSLLVCLSEIPAAQRTDLHWANADAELRSLLDSVQTAAVLYDRAGNLRASSLYFAEIFDLKSLELAKIIWFEDMDALLAPRFSDPAAFAKPFRRFLGGSRERVHDDLDLARPQPRILQRQGRPVLDARGRSVGWLEIFTDVTGKRQAQQGTLQTEKMAALGRLVAGIAHELNNPLTAIMGYSQLLLGHGLSAPQLAEAVKVRREAERARRIVKNLLYFARENKPERVCVRMNEIVERAVALRSYELKVENIVVECDLATDLPETMADPYQLQQVVLNLVVNAEQALLESRGQGRILVRTAHVVKDRRFRSRDRILLEISDDGPGIPHDVLSRIFEPFFTTKPPGVGTGLGLSIVYGIVHQHDGEVTVENPSQGGARFVVEIPVSPVVAAAAGSPEAISGEAAPSDAPRRGRILAIEDEPTVAQLIVDVLHEEGHTVEATLDSQDGLTRLSRGHFDLVICDLRMPRLDGPAFFDALVRSGSPMRHNILFITGDTLAPRTLAFLEGNQLPYLIKPFLVEELKLAVSALLHSRARVTQENGSVVHTVTAEPLR